MMIIQRCGGGTNAHRLQTMMTNPKPKPRPGLDWRSLWLPLMVVTAVISTAATSPTAIITSAGSHIGGANAQTMTQLMPTLPLPQPPGLLPSMAVRGQRPNPYLQTAAARGLSDTALKRLMSRRFPQDASSLPPPTPPDPLFFGAAAARSEPLQVFSDPTRGFPPQVSKDPHGTLMPTPDLDAMAAPPPKGATKEEIALWPFKLPSPQPGSSSSTAEGQDPNNPQHWKRGMPLNKLKPWTFDPYRLVRLQRQGVISMLPEDKSTPKAGPA